MVYFLQPTDGGALKIGFTTNLGARLKRLEAHYGCKLTVLHTMPGSRNDERATHERFAHLRFGKTEQFRPAPELLAFIGRPLLAHPDPDAVEPLTVTRTTVPLTVKGSPDWREWVERYAARRRKTCSNLIDEALERMARDDGFETPPKR